MAHFIYVASIGLREWNGNVAVGVVLICHDGYLDLCMYSIHDGYEIK